MRRSIFSAALLLSLTSCDTTPAPVDPSDSCAGVWSWGERLPFAWDGQWRINYVLGGDAGAADRITIAFDRVTAFESFEGFALVDASPIEFDNTTRQLTIRFSVQYTAPGGEKGEVVERVFTGCGDKTLLIGRYLNGEALMSPYVDP